MVKNEVIDLNFQDQEWGHWNLQNLIVATTTYGDVARPPVITCLAASHNNFRKINFR